MRKFTFLVAIVMLTFNMFAQKQATRSLLERGPKVYQTTQSKSLTTKAIDGVLNYDNSEIAFGLGNSGEHTMEVYHKFPAAYLTSLVGKEVTHFKVAMDDPSGYSKFLFRVRLDSADAAIAYEEEFTASELAEGFNLFELGTAYTIPADKDVLIGVYLESSGGYGLAVDTDPTPDPVNSSILIFNGTNNGSIAAAYGDFIIHGILTNDGTLDGGVKDLAISNVKPTTEDCTLSATEVLAVTLANFGDEKINEKFNLTVEVNESPITLQVSPTGFEAGTEITVNIESFDMSATGSYNVSASHDWADHVAFNNKFNNTITTGDAVITVDLLTDNYASETSWVITDADGNVIATNGPLSNAEQIITDVCVASTGCYSWTIYDSYGDGIAGYNAPAGAFTISYNGTVVATSPEDGNFGSVFSALGMGDGCPDNDMELLSLDLPDQMAPGELEIAGTLANNGLQTLTSFDVVYKIGDHTSATYSVSGVSVNIGETYDFTHDVAYDFTTDGNYTIEVTISNPNGVTDENLEDNTMSHDIVVKTGLLIKKQLFEHFTASTCPPCASYTPTADELQDANIGNFSLIRYQVNWPGAGDAYYIQEAGDRVSYYGVTGVPSVYRNGTYDMDVTQDVFDAYAAHTTLIGLEVTTELDGDNVSVSADITPISDVAAGLVAHIVIVENETTGNVGTNGETHFRNVMMAMLPSSAGTTLDALTANETVTLTESYDMSSTFVEEMDDLTAIVFVQNNETKEVLQSEMVAIGATATEVTLTFNVDMKDVEGFTAGTDEVYVTGSFAGEGDGWNEPGTGESVLLSDEDGDMVYTGTAMVAQNQTVEYKYFMNSGWDGGEWDGGDNRTIDIVDADVTVNDKFGVVSIETNKLGLVELFPNPFTNTLTVNNLTNASQVVISNVLGQTIETIAVENTMVTIPTNRLENGIYMITIIDNFNNSRTLRVVKQ